MSERNNQDTEPAYHSVENNLRLVDDGMHEKHCEALHVYYAIDGGVTETQIRKILSEEYGGDNSTRELVKNERLDNHGEIGSTVYSLSGSPPKGYAIQPGGHSGEVWFIDAHGRKFAEIIHVNEVISNE